MTWPEINGGINKATSGGPLWHIPRQSHRKGLKGKSYAAQMYARCLPNGICACPWKWYQSLTAIPMYIFFNIFTCAHLFVVLFLFRVSMSDVYFPRACATVTFAKPGIAASWFKTIPVRKFWLKDIFNTFHQVWQLESGHVKQSINISKMTLAGFSKYADICQYWISCWTI